MPKVDEKDGVWRTIGGRRVFIKDGQSVSDAMKESGKFKSASKTKTDTSNNVKEETTKKERTYEDVDKEWKEQASKMEKNYAEFGGNTIADEKKLNELSAERDRLSIHRDESSEKKEYTRQELKDKYGTDDVNLINAGKEKENRVSVKEEKESGKRPYETYLEKMKSHKEDDSWSGKEYTNDEFLEHLTDSNWHSERKALEDANLTDEQLGYIKDKTSLSKWGVGEELTGKQNVQKMIDEAKSKFGDKSTNETMNDAIRVKTSRSSLYKSKPESKEIESQGTSNRKEVSNNIQAHILDYYDSPKDFVEQMEAMGTSNMWKAGEEIARGGSYLIYNEDMSDFLDDLKINPKGKKFSEDKAFDMYTSLIGRESARLYEKLKKEETKGKSFNDSLRRKAYEKYLKEHPASKLKFNEFVKNNEK